MFYISENNELFEEAAVIIAEYMRENNFVKILDDELFVVEDNFVNLIWVYLFFNCTGNHLTNTNDHRSRRLPPIEPKVFVNLSKILQLDELLLKLILEKPPKVKNDWIREYFTSLGHICDFKHLQVCRHIVVNLINYSIANYDASDISIFNTIKLVLTSMTTNLNLKSRRMKGLVIFCILKILDVVLNNFSNSCNIGTNTVFSSNSSLDFLLETIFNTLLNSLEYQLLSVSGNTFMSWHEIDIKDHEGLCLEYSLQNLIAHMGHDVIMKAEEKNIPRGNGLKKLASIVYKRTDPKDELTSCSLETLVTLLLTNENTNQQKNVNYVVREFFSREDSDSHEEFSTILQRYHSNLTHKELVLVMKALTLLTKKEKDNSVKDIIANILQNRTQNELIKILVELNPFIGFGSIFLQRKKVEIIHSNNENFLKEIACEIIINSYTISKMLKEALTCKVKLNKNIQKMLIKKAILMFKFLLPIKYSIQKIVYNEINNLMDTSLPIQCSTTKTMIYFVDSMCDINFFNVETVLNCYILPFLFDFEMSGKTFMVFLLFAKYLKRNIKMVQLNAIWTLYLLAFYRLKSYCLSNSYKSIAINLIQHETTALLKLIA